MSRFSHTWWEQVRFGSTSSRTIVHLLPFLRRLLRPLPLLFQLYRRFYLHITPPLALPMALVHFFPPTMLLPSPETFLFFSGFFFSFPVEPFFVHNESLVYFFVTTSSLSLFHASTVVKSLVSQTYTPALTISPNIISTLSMQCKSYWYAKPSGWVVSLMMTMWSLIRVRGRSSFCNLRVYLVAVSCPPRSRAVPTSTLNADVPITARGTHRLNKLFASRLLSENFP